MKPLVSIFISFSLLSFPPLGHALYLLGCDDPKYAEYMDKRFDFFAQNNQRMYNQTLREYQQLKASQSNEYLQISALTRHLQYSAQLDPIDEVNAKIDALYQHSEQMSMEKRIAGFVVDEFSSENHAINMAKAWIAYRQNDLDKTTEALMVSLDVTDPMLLSAFGPDFSLIRALYKDGHVDTVKAFITKTENFWQSAQANRLRFIWRQMMILNCQIQFESTDIVKAGNLGIRTQR